MLLSLLPFCTKIADNFWHFLQHLRNKVAQLIVFGLLTKHVFERSKFKKTKKICQSQNLTLPLIWHLLFNLKVLVLRFITNINLLAIFQTSLERQLLKKTFYIHNNRFKLSLLVSKFTFLDISQEILPYDAWKWKSSDSTF